MRVPQGQPVRSTIEVRDLDQVLVTPTTIVFDYLDPTGANPVGPNPVVDAVGKYHVDLNDEIDLPGHYVLRWTTTGPGAGVKTDTLDVYDPFGAELLSLSAGKKYLQIAEENTVHDDEIAGFIRALTPTIEFFVGPVEPRTMTRTVVSTGGTLVLPVAPVLEVVSLDTYGFAADVAQLVVDNETGIVTWATPYAGYFRGQNRVTFIAGRRVVSDTIEHAAKVELAHLWETQRGRGSSTYSSRQAASDTTFVPGLGYSVPNRVIELLKPVGTRTGLS